jgi:hypothetical protein
MWRPVEGPTTIESMTIPENGERATLPQQPWWRSGAWVAGLTSILGASVTAGTMIGNAVTSWRELELAKMRYAHEVQSFYFKAAVDTASTNDLRQRVLRYLVLPHTGADGRHDPLRVWAQRELDEVDLVLEREVQQLNAALQRLRDEQQLLLEERLAAIKTTGAQKNELEKMQVELGQKSRLLGQRQAELAARLSERPILKQPQETAERKDEDAYRECIDQALSAYERGDWSGARSAFEMAYRWRPTARVERGLGMVAFNLEDYKAAIRYLGAALANTEGALDSTLRAHVAGLLKTAEERAQSSDIKLK